MAFKRLATPSAKTLNTFPQSDVRSGNNSTQRFSPNGAGYTTKGTQYIQWPYDPASLKDGGEVQAPPNPVVPPRLRSQGSTGVTP